MPFKSPPLFLPPPLSLSLSLSALRAHRELRATIFPSRLRVLLLLYRELSPSLRFPFSLSLSLSLGLVTSKKKGQPLVSSISFRGKKEKITICAINSAPNLFRLKKKIVVRKLEVRMRRILPGLMYPALPDTSLFPLKSPFRGFGNAPSRIRPWEIVVKAYNDVVNNVSILVPVCLVVASTMFGVLMFYELVVKRKSEAHLEFARNYGKTAHWSKQDSHSDDFVRK